MLQPFLTVNHMRHDRNVTLHHQMTLFCSRWISGATHGEQCHLHGQLKPSAARHCKEIGNFSGSSTHFRPKNGHRSLVKLIPIHLQTFHHSWWPHHSFSFRWKVETEFTSAAETEPTTGAEKTSGFVHLPILCCFRNRKFGGLAFFFSKWETRISVPSWSFKSLIKDLKATSQSPPQRTKEKFEAQNEPRVALVDPKTLEETKISKVCIVHWVYCITYAVMCFTWDVNHKEFGEVPLDVSTQPDRFLCAQEPDTDGSDFSTSLRKAHFPLSILEEAVQRSLTLSTLPCNASNSLFSQLSQSFPMILDDTPVGKTIINHPSNNNFYGRYCYHSQSWVIYGYQF